MNHKIIRTALALLFVSLLIAAPQAQQPAPVATTQSPEDRIALYQALLDLTNPWTVMCIAAHPDDEDGTSLLVMRRKYGAHTVSVFSTFGEGGQNAIGPELYEELGAIRARETMAAAQIQGSEPYFLGLKDFGYSKSADEAFRFWGHDEALRRMVLQIRKLRPDVIITNHSVTNNDHGHHQATARLELEAFDAAADPKLFPEQLKDGVTTWQVQRLFVRVRGNQGQKPDREGGREEIVTIDPNERDPIRDTTFVEEALRALQKHATQGPWPKTVAELAARFRNSPDGKLPITRYVLVREAEGAETVPKDSHNFLDGLRLPKKVARQLVPPTIGGHSLTDFVAQRERVLEALLAAWKNKSFAWPSSIVTDSHISSMTENLKTALAQASGFTLRITPSENVLVPGTTTTFSIMLANQGDREVRIRSGILFGPTFHKNKDQEEDVFAKKGPGLLAPGTFANISVNRTTPIGSEINLPMAAHLYDGHFVGERFTAGISLEIDGAKIILEAETHIDVTQPVEIISANPSPFVVTPATAGETSSFTLRIQNHAARPFEGSIYYRLGSREQITLNAGALRLQPNESKEVTESIPSLCKTVVGGTNLLSCVTEAVSFFASDGHEEEVNRRVFADKWRVKIIPADARVSPNLRVGYLRGFDYSLPNALGALGVESKELSVEGVRAGVLQKYSAIIVDNRVYESQPELIAGNQKLLDYAKDGGTLIVFYHKTNEWNPDPKRNRQQLAPYSLVLGDERVTDENAPVTFIEPQHLLLNFPNKMGQEDFAGWIQERGLYYPKEWDSHYTTLLASNDPGEQPLRGGLLVADYGRGHYIYTSMVWYRQLRAGVPGAYRMLANMVSYGRPTN